VVLSLHEGPRRLPAVVHAEAQARGCQPPRAPIGREPSAATPTPLRQACCVSA